MPNTQSTFTETEGSHLHSITPYSLPTTQTDSYPRAASIDIATPKKQVQFAGPAQQQPTPPRSSMKQQTASTRCILSNLRENGHEQVKPDEVQERIHQQPDNEVSRWIYSSSTREQQRARFTTILHSIWPSNEVFNSARHPFYDPEVDGPYDEFIKHQERDGHCPYDDDDYDLIADPTKSTEVWQPKVGDEAIESREDLRVVLKARRDHQRRSDNLRLRKNRVINAQLKEGVQCEDLDLTRIFFGPEIESDDDDFEEYKGAGAVASNVKMVAPSEANTPIQFTSAEQTPAMHSTLPFHNARGRGRPRGSKNRKSTNKRKREVDTTYKDAAESEDSEPIAKKPRKKATVTRRAARRALQTDGTADSSDQSTEYETSSSLESDGITGSTRSDISSSEQEDEPKQHKGYNNQAPGPKKNLVSSIATLFMN